MKNPYLDMFRSLPWFCRREFATSRNHGIDLIPEWLHFKYRIVSTYSWAVPTDGAVKVIGRNAADVVEIGCGSGYWAWLLSQRGIRIRAFDAAAPAVAWHPVERGDEHAGAAFPRHALFLCWPPWGSDMAYDALRSYAGDTVIYVGEWMGGCATEAFFKSLQEDFALADWASIPQWAMRDDQLFVFRRRRRSIVP